MIHRRFVIALLLSTQLAVFCSQDSNLQSTDPIDLASFKRVLMDQALIYTEFTEMPGFRIASFEEFETTAWAQRHRALISIRWRLDGPDDTDSIIFTLFPSVANACEAWDDGRPHLPPAFHVRSVTDADRQAIEEGVRPKLYNGRVGAGETANGFSIARMLLHNMIVTSYTITSLTGDGANAAAAVKLLQAAHYYLSDESRLFAALEQPGC